MQKCEIGAAPPVSDDNPLDRPFNAPMAAIPGIDIDVEAETNKRVWGIHRTKVEHASSEFERVVEYTDWTSDAAREGRYSQGHARSIHRGSNNIDGILGLPGLVWLAAAFEGSWEGAFIAAGCWLIALLFWTPWTLWRVWASNPKGDSRRAGGLLAGAWALLVLLIPAAFHPIALLAVFAVVYAVGLLLVFLALTVGPAPGPKAPVAG